MHHYHPHPTTRCALSISTAAGDDDFVVETRGMTSSTMAVTGDVCETEWFEWFPARVSRALSR